MDGSRIPQHLLLPPMVVPVVTKERFAELSGLTEGVVQGMIEKGHLPSIKFGRYRMVNLALLMKDCAAMALEEERAAH